MKMILLCFAFISAQFSFSQQNTSGYQLLAGKKIKSTVARATNPAGGDNSKSVNIGSTTVTSGNAASATNTVNRELLFRTNGDMVELERRFTRIATRTVNPFGEMVVDTDNPFERPAPMAKLGDKYDNLVKQRPVTLYSKGAASSAGTSNEFSFSWNEFVPYLTLDSALNLTWLSLPAGRSTGSSWTDSGSNARIAISLNFKITEVKGDTLMVSCSGFNRHTPPSAASANTVSANVYKLFTLFNADLKADARSGLIYSAAITATTQNRKLVLGQEVDNEIKEKISVTNVLQ